MGTLQRAAGPCAVGTAGGLTSVWGVGHSPSSPTAPRGDSICDGTTLNPGGRGGGEGLPGQTEGKQVETKTDSKKGEERGRDASKKPLGPRRDSDLGKEPKRGGLKKSFSRDKDEAEGKGAERPKEEKLVRGLEKGRVRAAVDKKEAGKEGRAQEGTAAPRKGEERQGSVNGDKGKKGEEKKEASQTEEAEKVQGQRKDTDTRTEGQEAERGSRDRGARPEDEKARKEEPRRAKAPREESKSPAAPERSAPGAPAEPADGPAQAEEEAAPSVFDEPLERVKSNDPEVTELNVNNSDCITPEILVRFAEALEFNTAVKVFALANTRADDHVAFAIAIMLKANKTITSLNLDSNHITGKGILAIFRALLQNTSLTELRFHNQRHICGGKTEMEMATLLKENTTLLKLGYHFELAGPRMTALHKCLIPGAEVSGQEESFQHVTEKTARLGPMRLASCQSPRIQKRCLPGTT
eukprot:bmy_09423T0